MEARFFFAQSISFLRYSHLVIDKNAFFERTMHTPDDPARARLRAALREISKILIPLHRNLIDEAKSDYVFAYEVVASPTHLLKLLKEHPFFAWLKPITSLIVDIDELARVDFHADDIASIFDRINRLFGHESEADFAAHYIPILQNNIDVAMAHGALRQAMRKLEREP